MDNANNANKTRVLTTIVYLNPDWKDGDGGELRIFSKLGQV
jgi:Rps23 Pro-64 3,4-dihydroxylase Tpa1-like proline 4-hydroxylase